MCAFDRFERGSKADQVDRWLSHYHGLKAKELQLAKTIEQNRAELDGIKAVRYDKDGGGSTPNDDAFVNQVARMDEINSRLESIREDTIRRRDAMESAIDALPDPTHSAILRGHYINRLRWEQLCAMDETATSYRTMMRWRKAALESIYDLDLIPPAERMPRVPAL